MSVYRDVEKEGCRTSITEADHGDEAASSRSRKRSYSGDIRRESPGGVYNNDSRPNSIRLDEPEVGFVGSKLNGVSTKLREIQYGRKSDPTPSSEDGMRFRISFAEVQRMRIRKLQCQLVRHVVKMRLNGSESPGWEQTLEQYIKALQDHDYMESRSKSIRDPFLATGEYGVDNYVLNCNIDSALAKDIAKHVDSLRPWDVRPAGANDPITGTRGSNVAKTWYRGFKERIVIAAAGGAFLVGPMWIMVLKNGLYASLISTTAFVTAFGILMAYFLDEAKDVLASTAAYAAVLVVFVGTSNP
ncbi:UDP-glucose 4-epimerase [Colletotrichum sp. SAR 10_77]|nr:UDP-glucose 4-epimerase [Colletotrichum sp. SAR 10_77]